MKALFVTQSFTLLYRRFSTCRGDSLQDALCNPKPCLAGQTAECNSAVQQSETLRYRISALTA